MQNGTFVFAEMFDHFTHPFVHQADKPAHLMHIFLPDSTIEAGPQPVQLVDPALDVTDSAEIVFLRQKLNELKYRAVEFQLAGFGLRDQDVLRQQLLCFAKYLLTRKLRKIARE